MSTEILVDEIDIPFINRYKWRPYWNGKTMYAQASAGRYRTVYLHRLIMSAHKGQQVDHIDGNGLNNTRENLRICSRSQNLANQGTQKHNTSGFKGVFFDTERKKLRAEIGWQGLRRNLGRFDNQIDAAKAYDKAALELHGAFAQLNFPKGDG
jgi:hypothetical protein